MFSIPGNKLFKRLIHIRDLTIEGAINGRSVEDILSGAVFLDEDNNLSEEFTFLSNVSIHRNSTISKYLYKNTLAIK